MPARHIIPTFRQTFLHGIVAGIGWAFGATIVFAILIGILGYVFNVLEHIPILDRLVFPVAEIVDETKDPRQKIINQEPTMPIEP